MATRVATWGMTTTSDAKARQIDRQATHIVEGDNGNDKEKEERYVVEDRAGIPSSHTGRSTPARASLRHSRIRVHLRVQSDNKPPAESVARDSSASMIDLEKSLQSTASRIS